MFSNFGIALIIAISFAAWLYAKLMRSSGNSTQSAAIGAGIAAFIVFLIAFTALGFIPSN